MPSLPDVSSDSESLKSKRDSPAPSQRHCPDTVEHDGTENVIDSGSKDHTRHLFGLKQGIFQQQDLKDSYEKRFPEDAVNEETGPNARVWRTYLAESAAFDENMVGEARDGLDVILVFAGLFSAVVTSFLVQTSQNLEVDFNEMSANLLYELVSVQRAVAQGASVSAVPPSPLNPATKFVPSVLDVWINGLWVVSLALGLVVALAAVLVKQWLHRYLALRSGAPKDRSHIRHYRYIGFEEWQVLAIIGSLPVIMHVSLGLFFVGLVLFLIPLHFALSYVIGAIIVVVFTLYLTTNILPVFFPQCPYQTPLSGFFFAFGAYVRSLAEALRFRFALSDTFDENRESVTLKDLETRAVDTIHDRLSVKALHWLFDMSSNTAVQSVVVQAISGLPAAVKLDVNAIFRFQDIQRVHGQLLLRCSSVNTENSWERQAIAGLEIVAERLWRLFLFFPNQEPSSAIAFPTLSDPSFEATSLATEPTGWGPLQNAQRYRLFISSHHDVSLHPLVWVNLLHNAHRHGLFTLEDDTNASAVLVRTLLPAVWGRFSSRTTPSVDLPMIGALRTYMHHDICEYLLRMLSSFDTPRDTPTTSLPTRVVMAAMRFALQHVSAYSSGSNLHSAYWNIIDHVLSDFSSADAFEFDHEMLYEQGFEDFIATFTRRLINRTTICDHHGHPAAEEALLERRTVVLRVYRRTWCNARNSGRVPWGAVGRFPSLLRLLKGSVREIRRLVDIDAGLDQTSGLASLSARASVTCNVLLLALRRGSPEAYQIVLEQQVLELLFICQAKRWVPLTLSAVGDYIDGLSMTEARDMTEHYIDYLHEPRNLCFAVMSLTLCPNHSTTIKLAQLRPHSSSWSACLHWLEILSDWAASGARSSSVLEFNDWGLGGKLINEIYAKHSNYRSLLLVVQWLEDFFDQRATVRLAIEATITRLQATASDATPSRAVTLTDTFLVNERREESRWKWSRMPRWMLTCRSSDELV